MTDLPRIAVCLLTYQRTEYAVRTIEAVIDNLRYEGEIGFYVADDGSDGPHVFAIMEALEAKDAKVFGSHSERLRSGPSWNRAVKNALEWADTVLWLEDDWELGEELDVTPYVRLLTERNDVGMVRLGYLAVGNKCLTVGHDGRHYLQMSKETQYAYSGNPSLRSRRYFEAYEWYPEDDRGPGDCEIWHDGKVRSKQGPEVWWPVDLGGWSVWRHIGQKQSY